MEYYRITAYHMNEDISVILDSYGKFDSLWDYSSYLVSHGFKILYISRSDRFAEAGCPNIKPSKKIAVRAIGRGLPIVEDMVFQNRKCKAITVGDKIYGLFAD